MGSWHGVGLETRVEQVVRTSPPQKKKKRVKKTGLNHETNYMHCYHTQTCAGAEDSSTMITLEFGSSYHCKTEFTS